MQSPGSNKIYKAILDKKDREKKREHRIEELTKKGNVLLFEPKEKLSYFNNSAKTRDNNMRIGYEEVLRRKDEIESFLDL